MQNLQKLLEQAVPRLVLVDYTGGSSSSTATYTTSSGDTFSFGGSFISGSFIESNGLSASFVPLSKELSTSGKKCDGEDDLDAGGKVNKLAEAIASGDQAQIEKWTLQSDYIANGDGTYSLKTLKQKAIDLAYMLQKGLLSTIPDPTTGKSEMWYSLVNFTDGDMKKLTSTPPIEPVKPTIEEPVMDSRLRSRRKCLFTLTKFTINQKLNGTLTSGTSWTEIQPRTKSILSMMSRRNLTTSPCRMFLKLQLRTTTIIF